MKLVFNNIVIDHLLVFTVELYLNYEKKNKVNFNSLKNQVEKKININKPAGTLIFIDVDSLGNKIFIMETKNYKKIVYKALMGFNNILKLENQFVFFDLEPYYNNYLKLASFCKYINLPAKIVNMIAFYGIRREFAELSTEISKSILIS